MRDFGRAFGSTISLRFLKSLILSFTVFAFHQLHAELPKELSPCLKFVSALAAGHSPKFFFADGIHVKESLSERDRPSDVNLNATEMALIKSDVEGIHQTVGGLAKPSHIFVRPNSNNIHLAGPIQILFHLDGTKDAREPRFDRAALNHEAAHMVMHQEVWRRLPGLLGISDSVIRQEVLAMHFKDVHRFGSVNGQSIAEFEGSEISNEAFEISLREYMQSNDFRVAPRIESETWKNQIDTAHKKLGLKRSLMYSSFLGDPYSELLADTAVVFYFRNRDAMADSNIFERDSIESRGRSFAPGQKASTWRSNRTHGLLRPVRSMIGERYWLDSGLTPQQTIPALFDAVWDEMSDPSPSHEKIGGYQGYWNQPNAKKVRAINESLMNRIEDRMNRVPK